MRDDTGRDDTGRDDAPIKDATNARVRIMDAAENLFAEHGYDATPTSTVAKLAGVPKGLLFYYFPAKADLLRALVCERLGLGPIDTASFVEPGNPVRSLLRLTKRIYEIQRTSEVMRVIVWREQRTHPEVKAQLLAHRDQVQAVVERVLEASLLKPLAHGRLRTAAQAWVSILTARPLADLSASTESDDSTTGLAELAELICDGLLHPRIVAGGN
jgi:AcrR family transcriptional regulator